MVTIDTQVFVLILEGMLLVFTIKNDVNCEFPFFLIHKEYSFSCKLMLKFNTEYFFQLFLMLEVWPFSCMYPVAKSTVDKGLDRFICV